MAAYMFALDTDIIAVYANYKQTNKQALKVKLENFEMQKQWLTSPAWYVGQFVFLRTKAATAFSAS